MIEGLNAARRGFSLGWGYLIQLQIIKLLFSEIIH